MFDSCLHKQNQVKALFSLCASEEEKYIKIIELGKTLPLLELHHKIPENVVKGCQSTVYLHTFMKDDLLHFEAESDALISSGLASILIQVYNEESPETILKCPPTYLEELGLSASLTPNRANGLYSIHLRMKQEALKFLMEQEKLK
jgi:cysteine desulfuration protein SufE